MHQRGNEEVQGTGLEAEEDGLSRRALLRVGLAGLAASILTAGAIEAGSALVRIHGQAPRAPVGSGSPAVEFTAARQPSPTLARATAPAETAEGAAARPLWASTWHDPIYRLDSYVQRRVGNRYPRRAVMLTVDDGPHPIWTPKYLRLFEKHDVAATFNVIGEQVHANRALLRAMVGQGHHIGNHTFHHPMNLPSLSATTIRRELADTTDAVVRAAGFRPRQFRAPGGVWGPDVFAEVARQQMMPLGWDIDPRDWALPGVDAIQDAMLAARPHDIVLCHDGGGDRSQTYRALERVIPALLARGYEFVTLPAPQ